MAPEASTIGQIRKGGARLPLILLVIVGKENGHYVTRNFLVDKVTEGKDGSGAVYGAYTQSNRSERLDQDTEVIDFRTQGAHKRASFPLT